MTLLQLSKLYATLNVRIQCRKNQNPEASRHVELLFLPVVHGEINSSPQKNGLPFFKIIATCLKEPSIVIYFKIVSTTTC